MSFNKIMIFKSRYRGNTMKMKYSPNIKESVIINTIMNISFDTLYFKDIDSKIVLSNKSHAALWGLDDPADAIGKTDFDFFPEEFAQKSYRMEQEIMATGTPIIGIVEKLRNPDGSNTWLSASKYPLFDVDGTIIGTWGTSKNVTSLKETEEELKKVNEELEEANRKLTILSSKDSLSDLYNKGYYIDVMKESFELYNKRCEKDNCKGFSLILFDLDNFKQVNDDYGHLMGDFMIKHISNIIEKSVRISDLCFRYGGDEFAVLVYETNLEDAKAIAEKVRKCVEASKAYFMGNEVQVTCSVGVATYDESSDYLSMIQIADERLYLSKRMGKNKVS